MSWIGFFNEIRMFHKSSLIHDVVWLCYDNAMDGSYTEKAYAILASNLYASIATVTPDNKSWNSPVFICYDNDFNFYWASAVLSQHSRNLQKNPSVFIVMYDTGVPWGQGQGIYISGQASVLTHQKDMEKVRQLRLGRASKANQPLTEFMNDSPRRLYQCIPDRIWLNVDRVVHGIAVDERAEVSLHDLQTLAKNT